MFKPGQKVVCVNDCFTPEIEALVPNRPVRNSVYTVRDVERARPSADPHPRKIISIRLVEIVNPPESRPGFAPLENAFGAWRFVPLDPKEKEEQEVQVIVEVKSTAAPAPRERQLV